MCVFQQQFDLYNDEKILTTRLLRLFSLCDIYFLLLSISSLLAAGFLPSRILTTVYNNDPPRTTNLIKYGNRKENRLRQGYFESEAPYNEKYQIATTFVETTRTSDKYISHSKNRTYIPATPITVASFFQM